MKLRPLTGKNTKISFMPTVSLKLQKLLIISLVLISGLTLTHYLHNEYSDKAWQVLSRDFSRLASSYADYIETGFQLRIEEINSVKRYFQASKNVSREEFNLFTGSLLDRPGGFKALLWVPAVAPHEKHGLEVRTSQELGKSYRIKGFHPHKKMNMHAAEQHKNAQKNAQKTTPATATKPHALKPSLAYYTPVLFAEPAHKNQHTLGFNLSSEAIRRQTILQAIETGEVIASERITLIHENNDPSGFILIDSVFQPGLVTDTSIPENLKGFIVGRMSANSVMQQAINKLPKNEFVISLFERDDYDVYEVMASHGDKSNLFIAHTAEKEILFNRTIYFAGHQWEIVIRPTQQFIKEHSNFNGTLILFPGITLSLLISFYISTLLNQRAMAQETADQTSSQLITSKSLLNQAQLIAQLGSWKLDHQTQELIWSESLFKLLGLSHKQKPAKIEAFRQLFPKDHLHISRLFQAHINTGADYEVIHEYQLPDKPLQYLKENCTTRFDKKNRPIETVGTIQDITEQKLNEAQIEHLAHHDALTGLPNSILFRESFRQARAQANRNNCKLALIFIDLDRFKIINDSLGHGAGDKLLQEVAARLKESVRETDILSRQGGDEFLVCLTDINSSQKVSQICEFIINRLHATFEIDGKDLGISASLGIAFYPDNATDFNNLLRQADTAMYSAKDAGRNTYRFFSEEMNFDMLKRLQMLDDIRRGLNRDEFFLHYQPQVDMQSGRIVGAEALMRWVKKDGTAIGPYDFIPVAEESGLILQMGSLALSQACKQLAAWRNAGHELSMAVNVSVAQLSTLELLTDVGKLTSEYKIPVSAIDLELTESLLLQDTEKMVLMVTTIKEFGVKLSIDDFGTGYSSLSYLKRLNADKLKIDRSFIRDLPEDADSISITRAIIHMAHDLGLSIVAEGIETEAQHNLLQEMGCDISQGYYFSKPVDADTFTSLLEKQNIITSNTQSRA